MTWMFGISLIFLMMLFCRPGETIKCYLCSTQDNETLCLDPESYNVPRVHCDQTALNQTRSFAKRIDPTYDKIFEIDTSDMDNHIELNCLKVETKLGNRVHTFRGCQLAERANLDICANMTKADNEFLKKIHCSRCSEDGCNSASKLKLGYLFLILAVSLFIYTSF